MNITIDFGGTNIKIGLVLEGTVIAKRSMPACSDIGLFARLPDVEHAVHELLQELDIRLSSCRGVGIALPGIVDEKRKTLTSIKEKYMDAIGFDFAGWVDSAFGLPLAVENDARAALVGEIAYGAARGVQDAVLVIFGTGIGTAAIMNGHIVRGRHHQAGILGGHFSTNIFGEVCACGNKGCLEAHASHWAIPRLISKQTGFQSSPLSQVESPGYEAVIKASVAGDQLSVQLLQELLRHWSAGIINLIHAYDPEVVILSGGLMKSADYILPQLTTRVLEAAWTPWGTPRFAVADDPETSVLLGMSYQVSKEYDKGEINANGS